MDFAMVSRWEKLLVVLKEDMMAARMGGNSDKTTALRMVSSTAQLMGQQKGIGKETMLAILMGGQMAASMDVATAEHLVVSMAVQLEALLEGPTVVE